MKSSLFQTINRCPVNSEIREVSPTPKKIFSPRRTVETLSRDIKSIINSATMALKVDEVRVFHICLFGEQALI